MRETEIRQINQERINRLEAEAEALHIPEPQSGSDDGGGGGTGMYIAQVDSDATGGGYYNCHLQTLDATNWDTTTADQLDDTGDSLAVLNLCEIGSSIHNLDAGDLIVCWQFTDDEGNSRYVGIEVQGRHDFGEW